MKVVRITLLPALLAAAFFVGEAGKPEAAHALESHFCGYVLEPGLGCSNWPNANHWDRVRSRYPGAQAHNVGACVSLYNTTNGSLLNGQWYCNPTWSSPTWNPMGHNFGNITAAIFTAQNKLQLGTPGNHTLVGWASTNQTDG